VSDECVVVAAIHPVRDFEQWKAVVQSMDDNTGSGVVRRRIFRSNDDPNEVMILVEMASLDAANAMIPSFGMRDLLDRAGVEIYPAVFLGTEVEELGRGGEPAVE
jgi:hypothetical protein